MQEKTAVIAGASGLVGGLCLHLLLDSMEYSHVIALVRCKMDVYHPRLTQRIVDFDELPPFRLFRPHDVYCALGTTLKKAGSQEGFRKIDLDYPRFVAERAIEAGAHQYLLVSSVGASAHSANLYLRTKGQVELAVATLPYRAVHFFHPSLLIGERREQRPAEKTATKAFRFLAPALVGPLRKFRPIAASDVAAAMLSAARAAEPGRHIYAYDDIVRLARTEQRLEAGFGR